MRSGCLFVIAIATGLAVAISAGEAEAISPRNPYRTFNLSGVNYGSMRWEQAQRKGRQVWPNYGRSSRSSRRSRPTLAIGGVAGGGGGAVVRQGSNRTGSTGAVTTTQESSR